MTAPWGVVVPVKRLDVAKSRLAAHGDAARRELALAFAMDVVAAALSCPVVLRVLVVTDDALAAEALAGLGADVAPDSPGAGLNPALSHGGDLLRAGSAGLGIVTVSSDLPAASAADLGELLRQVPHGQRAFVADADGRGTTVLAAAAPAALLPSYGHGSRERHRASGARELAGAPGLRRDVDTPQDLREAIRLGVGAHTAAAAGVHLAGAG